jgi:hypothetical protein
MLKIGSSRQFGGCASCLDFEHTIFPNAMYLVDTVSKLSWFAMLLI